MESEILPELCVVCSLSATIDMPPMVAVIGGYAHLSCIDTYTPAAPAGAREAECSFCHGRPGNDGAGPMMAADETPDAPMICGACATLAAKFFGRAPSGASEQELRACWNAAVRWREQRASQQLTGPVVLEGAFTRYLATRTRDGEGA